MTHARVSRRLLVALLLLFVATACQAQADINLDVAADGSGTVQVAGELDPAANRLLGGVVGQARLSDLRDAGWAVDLENLDGGGASLLAVKSVPSPEQWQATLDEIAGPGVFDSVRVDVDDDRRRLRFELNLQDGWELLSDAEVVEAFDGDLFGAPLDELTDGRTIDEVVELAISASVRNYDDREPTVLSISPRFDEGTHSFSVVATAENSTAVLVRWVAMALSALFALALVLAVTGIVLQRRSDRLRPRRRPDGLAARVPGRSGATASAPASVAANRSSDPVRLVVVEAQAVLYAVIRPLEDQVLTFVRARGGRARADTIAEGHAAVVAGSMTTARFWELCGLEGDAEEIDRDFIAQRALHRDVAGFLRELQRRRIPIAAITTDATSWSLGAREHDRLSVVWPWLISAEVGATSAEAAMFEVLRRESGVAFAHCLFVDNDVARLDLARGLGMHTALFDLDGSSRSTVVNHRVVTGLKDLLAAK